MRLALTIPLLIIGVAFGQTVPPPTAISVGSAANVFGGVSPGSYLSIRVNGYQSGLPLTGSSQLDASALQVTLTSSSGKVFTVPAMSRPTPLETWVVIPPDMPLGAATATVSAKDVSFANVPFTVVNAVPGLFTRTVTGYTWNTTSGSGNYSATSVGPALAQNNPVLDSKLNGLTNPAVPGQFVTLWGTGLGLASVGTSGWTIDLAGTSIVPSFVGSNGPGLDQINFKIPANPQIGCYVPVTLKHGDDLVSNSVTLSINSTPGACAHPLGISYAQLAALDAGATIWLGQVNISDGVVQTTDLPASPPPPNKPSEGVSAYFGMEDANQVFTLAGTQIPYDQMFGCYISAGSNGVAGGGIRAASAGSPLVLDGPQGKHLEVPSDPFSGPYILQLPDSMLPFFTAGTWTVSAPGNTDIGPFQRSFTLPPPVSGLNRDELASLRTGDNVTVRWNNQGYGINDIATVTLVGRLNAAVCRTYAFLGVVTMPQIPVADIGGKVTLSIAPPNTERPQFTVPVVAAGAAAGSVAQTVVNYTYFDTAWVQFH